MATRGRTPDFPGLQEKIEDLLPSIFDNEDQVLKGPEIKERLRKKHADQFTDGELGAIEKRWGNYASRAKQNGILVSLGTAKGYRLWKSETETVSRQTTETGKARQHWESFVHFPATLLLSHQFESRVVSLPAKLTNQTWANPDMLMIRRNNLHSFVQNVIDSELLSNLDNTPSWILSSIEVKYSLGTNRKSVLDALSETAINGSWANENWLVYADEPGVQTALDEDAMAFASRNGIGIIELSVEVLDDSKYMNLQVIRKADIRPSLSIKSDFGSQGSKERLAKRIQELLIDFQERGTYLDLQHIEESDVTDHMSIADLVFDAVKNLSVQTGYVDQSQSEESPIDFSKLEKRTKELNKKVATVFLSAIGATLENLVGGTELPESEDEWRKRLGKMESQKLDTVAPAVTALMKHGTAIPTQSNSDGAKPNAS